MFWDQDTIDLLDYRHNCKVDKDWIKDIWDGTVLWELLNKKIIVDSQVQEYTYRILKMDMSLALTCNGTLWIVRPGERAGHQSYQVKE